MVNSNTKGDKGQSDFALILQERGALIVETSKGRQCEDIFAIEDGIATAWEVKNRATWDIRPFRKQARESARKRGAKVRWGLACRVPDQRCCFYIERQGKDPTVWRSR